MAFCTYHAVELFPHTDVNHVQLWIAANIDDCNPGSGYHLLHGVDTFDSAATVLLFVSQNDAQVFEEDYDADWDHTVD